MTTGGQKIHAYAVHAFTASGAGVGLLALQAAWERDFAACFIWLALALFIDGVDGTLARLARVKEHAPHIDGDTLDNVVDFLTYVIVPVVAFARSSLAPDWVAMPLALIIVGASALYFADKRMKTHDHWFRGFPAIWNILIFYLFAFQPPQWMSVAIVLAGVAGMFTPVVFVHPVRVTRLRTVTTIMLAVWTASAAVTLSSGFKPNMYAAAGLGLAAVYFLALPLARRSPLAD